MAVPGRLVLAKNPAQGTALVPHTSLRRLAVHKVRLCRGAARFLPGGEAVEKSVIASQCAPRSKCPWGTHWRGNPFLKRTNSALFAGFCLKRYGFPRRFAPRSKCPWGTPRNDRGEVYRHAGRPVFTGRFSVAILPEVWYNRTNVGRQVCLCGYWASIPASPLWASG